MGKNVKKQFSLNILIVTNYKKITFINGQYNGCWYICKMFSIAYVSANVISLPNEKEIFVTYLLHKGFFDSTHKTFRYISDTHLYKGSIVLRNGSIFEKRISQR